MNELIQVDFDTMGTTTTVTMGSEHAWRAASLRGQLEEVCSWFDQRYSPYKESSDLQKLRREGGELSRWPHDFRDIATQGLSWEAETNGHFTMTSATGVWDPTGIVKARAIDSLAILLQAQGVTEFSVNIGGDIQYSDRLNSSELSRVAISQPTSIADGRWSPLMALDIAASPFRAVATSGLSERGEHIWSHAASEVSQATVIAPDIVSADVWATALVAGGAAALERFIRAEAGEAIVIHRDRHIVLTQGVSALIAATPTPHELPQAC